MTLPPSKPGSRALRKGRVSIPNQLYLVTTVCHGRQRHFIDWPVASAVCETLADPGLWRGSELQCWVLMPDHLHALVALGEQEDLSHLMRRVKAVTSRIAKDAGVGVPETPIWEHGFHDRALRHEDVIVNVARYIVANPVRAGIVLSVRDYPYWDAKWL